MQQSLYMDGRGTALLAGLLIAAFLIVGGCQKKGVSTSDITGSIPATSSYPITQEQGKTYAAKWQAKCQENPKDRPACLNFAIGLRAATQYGQAISVLQTLAIHYPEDLEVLAAYGKALADGGRLQEAAEVLSHAHTPDRPNWSVLSSQGAVADAIGNHASAQNYYMAALKLSPENPIILSNLGLSYALEKKVPLAEEVLRRAAGAPGADARIRRNYALVLTLDGKFSEAEKIQFQDVSPQEAAQNVAAFRSVIGSSPKGKS